MNKKLFNEISILSTEQLNPSTVDIDISSSLDIVKMINEEDKLVASAVEKVLPEIAESIEIVVESFKNGGRLIYVGAGTSGRLGIVDASECTPTFGTDPEMVQGLIAGGTSAIFKAVEGAEDNPELAIKDLQNINLNSNDVLCGLAASGRTPYVKGAIEYANDIFCKTIMISTVPITQLIDLGVSADKMICAVVGPEVIMGSTRMKSGTAQKMILNMLTTGSMIKLGKTFNNVMIDLQMSNDKLKERAKRILMMITGVDYETASKKLIEAKLHVKSAIVMILTDCSYEEAQVKLKKSDGLVKKAINH